jgi:hypothetical protein
MRKPGMVLGVLLGGVTGGVIGCGGDDAPKSCDLARPVDSCESKQVCEDVAGQPTCVAPVVLRGRVLDPQGRGVSGALVAALDANDAPASGTATSATDGAYELRIPVQRTAAGVPVVYKVRLRASAAGFETFPSGLRRSLPFELSNAMMVEGKLAFQSTATDIVLVPLANAGGLGSISGTVAGEPGKRGVLVVAEGPATATAISDVDGAFVIFNVTPGSYTVRGYAAGVQLQPAMATVAAGARADKVDLQLRDVPVGSVSGTVSIVNAPGGSMTSVVLVVKSTFNATLNRGEVPPGLRAPRAGVPSVSGQFTIEGVPDGTYKVLAAFENDSLVRDPDTNIGGTQIQEVEIGDGGRVKTLEAGFKITEALTVMRPGAGEVPDVMASNALSFSWKDDSSEDRYTLELFDSRGTMVWNVGVPKQTGGDVTVPYNGPALQSGALYQFRATSIHREVPISQTEDLRGVFQMQ